MAAVHRGRIGAPADLDFILSFAFANMVFDGSGDKCAFIFQSETTDAITHLGYRHGLRIGTPPTMQISLQSVDTTTGAPTGTVLGGGSPASATFTPPADTTWDGTWRKIALANSYTPTRGQVLAIVVEYSSGTIDGSNGMSATYDWGPDNGGMFPRSAINTAGTWAQQSRIPPYAYYTASACFGQPVESVTQTTYLPSSTPDEYALRFALPAGWGDTYAVMGFRGFVKSPGTASSPTFTATLYDTDGSTALQSLTLDVPPMGTSATGRIVEFIFDEATLSTLSFGSAYRIGITTTVQNTYLTTVDADTATEAAAFPWGGDFYLSTRADAGAWTDDTTKRPAMELILADITEPAGGSGGGGRVIGGGF